MKTDSPSTNAAVLSAVTAFIFALGGTWNLWRYLDQRNGLVLTVISFTNCVIWAYNWRRLKKAGIAESREAGGECPACGYDLTGNVSGTCPECGDKVG